MYVCGPINTSPTGGGGGGRPAKEGQINKTQLLRDRKLQIKSNRAIHHTHKYVRTECRTGININILTGCTSALRDNASNISQLRTQWKCMLPSEVDISTSVSFTNSANVKSREITKLFGFKILEALTSPNFMVKTAFFLSII